MAQMQVDPELIAQLAARLSGGATELTDKVMKFQADAVSVLEANWKSVSGTAYETAFRDWQASAERMIEALEQLGLVANTASENFDNADQSSIISHK